MKTKLLGMIAGCVLALTAGAANANTYTLTGTFGPGSVSFCDFSGCSALPPTDSGSISGSVVIDNDKVLNFNIGVQIGSTTPSKSTIPSYLYTNNNLANWNSANSQLVLFDGTYTALNIFFNFDNDTFFCRGYIH